MENTKDLDVELGGAELAAKARDMHADYRSASCDDVARAVDREMQYRAALLNLRAGMAEAKNTNIVDYIDAVLGAGRRPVALTDVLGAWLKGDCRHEMDSESPSGRGSSAASETLRAHQAAGDRLAGASHQAMRELMNKADELWNTRVEPEEQSGEVKP